ncbi:unnamed protein product, partial [Polarella glacialis]
MQQRGSSSSSTAGPSQTTMRSFVRALVRSELGLYEGERPTAEEEDLEASLFLQSFQRLSSAPKRRASTGPAEESAVDDLIAAHLLEGRRAGGSR